LILFIVSLSIQIRHCVSDAGANMVKALNLVNILGSMTASEFIGVSIENLSSDDLQSVENEFQESDSVGDCLPLFRATVCAAHQIQLLIQDAIRQDPETMLLVKHLHKIVRFIRRRGKLQEIIRLFTGKTLTQPCVTRWSSIIYAARALMDVSTFII
jgi:hypothetical protein